MTLYLSLCPCILLLFVILLSCQVSVCCYGCVAISFSVLIHSIIVQDIEVLLYYYNIQFRHM